MGQVSPFLRKTERGYSHWCPACCEMHPLPNTWQFDGNVNKPTFVPSFKHEGYKTVKDANGIWTGDWVMVNGKPIPEVCHYILTNGVLNFCVDCTHSLAGQSVPLPALPEFYTDSNCADP